MTPPPPCWRLLLIGASSPFMTHPFAHPSGPSSVAHDSSVKTTYFITDFMHFLAQLKRKSLCLDESRGLFCDVLCFAIRPSILFHVRLGKSGRPDSWKIVLLIAPVTFRKFLFKLLMSRLVTDLRTLRSERVFLFLMQPFYFKFRQFTKAPLLGLFLKITPLDHGQEIVEPCLRL